MNELIIDLVVGHLGSVMSFADFVNHLNWNRTLDKTSMEKTLINLSYTNRAWSHYARLVLRRRIVAFDGAFSLRQYFRRNERLIDGESVPQRPWVREVYFAMKNKQGRRSLAHAAQLLIHLFQTCPNVEELLIYTCFQSEGSPFVPVIHSLGGLQHLKAIWLQHTFLHTLRFVPNLSDFLLVLPKLQRLERLFIGRWEPYQFDDTISAWRTLSLSGASGVDVEFSPPDSLKTVSLTSLSYFGYLGGDSCAYSWLLNPADARKYAPTALAFDFEDLGRPFHSMPGPRYFFECAQNSIPIISRLRLYNYSPGHKLLLEKVMARCEALDHLSLILQGWAMSERRQFGIVLENVDPLLLFSVLPRSVRELHVHFENSRPWDRRHDFIRDRMLVDELEIAPQLKKVILSRAPLPDDIAHLRTFEMTSNYCATKGIDLLILDTLSPPLF